MIIVIPCSAREEFGLWEFPCIVDNGWCQGKPSISTLIQNIRRYRPEFAIAIDGDLRVSLKLKERYPNIKWVYPAHEVHELEYWRFGFLVGLCTRWKTPNFARNYNVKTYLEKVPRGFRFILGLSYRDLSVLPLQEFDYADVAFIFTNAIFGKDVRGRRVGKVNVRKELEKLLTLIKSRVTLTTWLN